MKNLILIACFLQSVFFLGQDLSSYKGIESRGSLPKDFLTHSSDKFEESIDNEIDSEDKRSTKKAKKSFLLMSSYELRDLLYSGKIVFNDTLSHYVNQVAKKVLEKDTELKDEIRFYVVKSSAVNGFATNDGMIFITMGLISQIENEAQLAYVLSHEIAHYKKKHVINKYVEDSKNSKKINNYNSSARNELMIKRNKYSKELETEADIVGFKLFSKTNYKKKGVERVFDVLKYSYLPFDEVAFDTTIYQNEFYQFPESYWVDELNEIAIDEEYDEEKSTHPSPDIRKSKVSDLIDASGNAEEGVQYLVRDKAYFKYIRNVARFEISKILLTEHKYKEAVYHTYLLQQEFKDNQYLDEMMNFAFYYLFRNDMSSFYNLINDSNSDYTRASEIEGESHMVYYWLEKMPAKEIGVLALKRALENSNKYPSNKKFKDIAFDLMYLLAREYDLTYDSFRKEFPEPEIEVEEIKDSLEQEEGLSKLDKIKQQSKNKEKEVLEKEEYYKFALVELFAEKNSILEDYEIALAAAKKTIEKNDGTRSLSAKERKKIARRGQAFGIDKMVIVNPEYDKLNFKKRQSVDYVESEDAVLNLNKEIKDAAILTGLEVDVLDNLSMGANDISRFNDFMFLNSWLTHSSRFLEKADTSFLVCLDEEKITELASKYNSDYYCWTGFTGVHEKKHGKGGMLILSAIYVVTLPYGIYYAVTPRYSMSYYSIVFNLKTKKAVWGMSEDFQNKDSGSVVKSILYDTFYQLKRTKKGNK